MLVVVIITIIIIIIIVIVIIIINRRVQQRKGVAPGPGSVEEGELQQRLLEVQRAGELQKKGEHAVEPADEGLVQRQTLSITMLSWARYDVPLSLQHTVHMPSHDCLLNFHPSAHLPSLAPSTPSGDRSGPTQGKACLYKIHYVC